MSEKCYYCGGPIHGNSMLSCANDLAARLAAAEASLNGTPRTADGAAITDGTQLFRYVDGDLVTMQVKLCYVVPEDDNGLCAGATTWKFSEWYSSDEAAKAGGRDVSM